MGNHGSCFFLHNPSFQFGIAPDNPKRHLPQFFFRIPRTACCLQLVPERFFGIEHHNGNNIFVSVADGGTQGPFFNDEFDGFQAYAAKFVIPVADTEQCTSILLL